VHKKPGTTKTLLKTTGIELSLNTLMAYCVLQIYRSFNGNLNPTKSTSGQKWGQWLFVNFTHKVSYTDYLINGYDKCYALAGLA
jgi:hypothetical protein